MRCLVFAILVGCWLVKPCAAQYTTGCLVDSVKYEAVPETAPLVRGDYQVSAAASLKRFCPQPLDQGSTGTCTAWATTYAARTILYAQRNNISGREAASRTAFSPSFVYNQIRLTPDCSTGSYIADAMYILKTQGAPFYNTFGFECSRAVRPDDRLSARAHTIREYKRLFSIYAPSSKVSMVKKSLSENKPVIISILCFKSWDNVKNVWIPPATNDVSKGPHAVTVVGYDDNQFGGAFEIMNSWGKDWGSQGFMWIRYRDFERFCQEAYEMSDGPAAASPTPGPSNKPAESTAFGGDVQLKKSDGSAIETTYERGIYRTRQALISGTTFQFFISHQSPVYLYAVAIDQRGMAKLVFPFRNNISPFMSYSKATVAYPGEDYFLQLDNSKGSEYLCLIYSRRALDMNPVLNAIEDTPGSVAEKVNKALGDQLLPTAQVRYKSTGGMGFQASAASPSAGNAVPLIVEIRR